MVRRPNQATQRGVRATQTGEPDSGELFASFAYDPEAVGENNPHDETPVSLLPLCVINLATGYHFISRTPGVVGIICVGDEPSEIADSVIQEIKSRAPNGIVDVTEQNFRAGDAVHVAHGALRGISAIFEQYLSGSERAALLLEFMGAGNVRAVLPSKLLMRENKDHF
jgi:hypothetical protein